jgi:ribosome-binding factor A
MNMDTTRQLKIAKQLQKDLGELLQQRGMAAFSGALVTISGVKVSPDLGVAKVYVSIFPSTKSKEVLGIIVGQNRQLRYELGKRVRNQLRIVPELVFFLDDSLDYVDKIESVFQRIGPIGGNDEGEENALES